MAQISIRVDNKTKQDAEIACDELGISMASALKKLGREKKNSI